MKLILGLKLFANLYFSNSIIQVFFTFLLI